MEQDEILNNSREIVNNDYDSAKRNNYELFLKGNVTASSEYIYRNQREDAHKICNIFLETSKRVISIVKKTKVGMDGLMIEIAKIMTTHPDKGCLHRDNIFFLTGMSNKQWEDDMKDKIPACFKTNVYHHGKLTHLKTKLEEHNIKDAIFITDEIDSGDKQDQVLHRVLKKSNVLDIKYMEDNNIRFVFVSATMINELRELFKWGDKHECYRMTIPENYIGHKEFLEKDIIKEFYPIRNNEDAEKWVREDILENYGSEYRVHIIRTDKKNIHFIINACINNNIDYKNHTSDNRLSYKDFSEIFNNINKHVVILIKGLFRRANLIPNEWKKKIGATHERHVKKYDTNVQVQGLPGRMTGYWRQEIEGGHKTGPYRTSIAAMWESEKFYNNPTGNINYKTTNSKQLMVNPSNILNLKTNKQFEEKVDENKYRVYSDESVIKNVCKILNYQYKPTKDNSNGFKETSLNEKKSVVSLKDAISKVPSAYGTNQGKKTWRTYLPCYKDINDKKTLCFVLIIRDGNIEKVKRDIDTVYPNLTI